MKLRKSVHTDFQCRMLSPANQLYFKKFRYGKITESGFCAKLSLNDSLSPLIGYHQTVPCCTLVILGMQTIGYLFKEKYVLFF